MKNYHENTSAEFMPYPVDDSKVLLIEYFAQRKARKIKYDGSDIIEISSGQYKLLNQSQGKTAYFKSRSNSFYFKKLGSRSVIRISDHWSESQYSRSKN